MGEIHAGSAAWSGRDAPPDEAVADLRAGRPVSPGPDEPAGPGAALDVFLKSVERKAYHIARYALWDHEAALDTVQDSMLRLVEKYSGRPPSEWPALFRTILNNRINDARRARTVRNRIMRLVPLGGAGHDANDESNAAPAAREPPGTAAAPERALHGRRLRERIETAVAALSWRQRQVFLLREVQGFDVKETAQALGCSEGSVKQHHFRAMQALRRELAEVWTDETD